MRPLQKVAMGQVIVMLDVTLPPFGRLDAVPDPLGWLLVALGVLDLRGVLRSFSTLLGLATVAGVLSAVLMWPPVLDSVPDSTEWMLSLPQVVFGIVLCGDLAARFSAGSPDVARRLTILRNVFIFAAVAPLLVYGGGLDFLLVPVAVLVVGSAVYFVYLLFRLSSEPAVTRPKPSPAS